MAKAKTVSREYGLNSVEAISVVFHDTETGGEFAVAKPEAAGQETASPEEAVDESIAGIASIAERIQSGELQITPEEAAQQIASTNPELSEEEVFAILTEMLAGA